jgi:hypothetical protein
MTAETIFQISNIIALLGWLVLIVIPIRFQPDKFIVGIIVTLFCLTYAWLVAFYFSVDDLKKFGSLDGVMNLFTRPEIVVAGWVHYLAFDLMTGVFIRRNAIKHGIKHGLIILPLFFTFMLGPIGLLLYLAIRVSVSKKYFADNS